MNNTDHTSSDDSWLWLDNPETHSPQPGTGPTRLPPRESAVASGSSAVEGPWPGTSLTRNHRVIGQTRRRVVLGLGLAAAVSAALIGAGIADIAGDTTTEVAAPTLTAARPPDTSRAPAACMGLSGTTITSDAGDDASLTGVIAAFEHAYYVRRDPAAAMGVLAPDTGITAEALAAGIASIPTGTTHCVAITPIADTAAEIHLVQLHPDRSRVDYLQLVNVSPRADHPHEVWITNIQKR
ncbi:hypothetical protein [Nocardia cyriacigeorgica]|uniref:DUF8176 domain-containing protein n=1 Tax=Nocardia cyriacigeorgica TaxID=135487 RepID=A0A5R8NDG3_9NOCA|nr:hypothetical protein [Nocardia cyriacigeorgica]MBF6095751.1 hypothetical protein [Nocardia cyriacigeorgica]TLF73646.1 hypothetical protein FEK34_26525 [Nocardia cyriacigeorgica]